MGVKGFQKGHPVSDETRAKISKANDGNFFATCDYCGKEFHTKRSAFSKRKRHFCCRECYAKYRAEKLPKEEQNAYGTGLRKKNARKELKREVFLTTTCETSTCKGNRVKYAVRQQKRITMITISR